MAQYPVLLPGTDVTLTNAGASHATLVALVVVAIAAVILVVPSFALLFTLRGRRMLGGGEQGTPPAAGSHRAGSATQGVAPGLAAPTAITRGRRAR